MMLVFVSGNSIVMPVPHVIPGLTGGLIHPWPNEITSEQAMLAAYDVLSRIFGQRAVVNAYYRTDPIQWLSETMMTSSLST